MRPISLFCGAAVVALIAGCGVPADKGATFADAGDVPFGLLAPSSTTTTMEPPVPAVSVQLCFRHGEQVVPAPRDVAPSAARDLERILEELNAGPLPAERQRGLRSALFAEDLVRSVGVVGGVATVDLSPAFADGSSTDQLLALAELVCTLTAQPGVGQLGFTLAGVAIDVPRADGSITGDPLARDDYRSLIGQSP